MVPGRPVPKARPRFGTNGQVYTPTTTRDAERSIGWEYRNNHREEPLAGAVAVDITFYFRGTRAGDIDNYLKTVLDGLNGIAWLDDRQIMRLTAEMVFGDDDSTYIIIDELARPTDGLPKEEDGER